MNFLNFFKKSMFLFFVSLFFFYILFFSKFVFSLSLKDVSFSNMTIVNDKIFIPKYSVLKVSFDSIVDVNDVYFTLNGETVYFDSCESNICSSNLNFYVGGKYDLKFYYKGNFLDKKTFVVDKGKIFVDDYSLYSNGEGLFFKAKFSDYANNDNSILGCGLKRISVLKSGSEKKVVFEKEFNNIQNNVDFNVDVLKDFSPPFTFVFEDCFYNKNIILVSDFDFNPPKILSVNGFENSDVKTSFKDNGFEKLLFFNVKIEEDKSVSLDKSFLSLESSDSKFSSSLSFSSCNSFFDNGKKYFLCQGVFSIPFISDFKLKIRVSDGNSFDEKDFNVKIINDNSPPKLLGFSSTSRGYNEELFLNKIFFVKFKEDNFIDENSVVVKLNNFNSLELSPKTCFKNDNNIVKCVFDISNLYDKFSSDIFNNGLEVSLISAKDYSGNSFVFEDNNVKSAVFFFDDKKPKVEAFLLGFDNTFFDKNIVFDSPVDFNVKVVVRKEGSKLQKVFYLKQISESQFEYVPLKKLSCENSANFYICIFEGFNIDSSSKLKFSVVDSSNNSLIVEKDVVVSSSSFNSDSDLWIIDENNIVVSPTYFFPSYDSEFSVYVPLVKSVLNKNLVLSSSIVSCSSDDASITFINSYSDKDSVSISGFLNSDSNSKIKVDCELKLKSYSSFSNSFSDFEDHSFSFFLYPFSPSETGYNTFLNDDGTFKTSFFTSSTSSSILSSAENFVDFSTTLCDTLKAIKTGSVSSDAIAIATKYGIVTSIAYPSVKEIADKLYNINENYEKYSEKFCGFIECNNPWSEKIESFYNNIEAPVKNYLSPYGLDFKTKDVKDSLILSSIALCAPGIVKQLKKIQNIDCASQLCYLYSLEGKVPISYCDFSSSIAYCQYTGNEFLEVVPFGDLVDSFKIVGDVLEHPFTYISGLIVDIASKYIEDIRIVVEIKKLYDMFDGLISDNANVNDDVFNNKDYCSILNDKIEEFNNNVNNV